MIVSSTVRLFPAVITIPLVAPDPGNGTITRLRNETETPAVAMLKAGPPSATTLPIAPGIARIDADLVTLTGPLL
jgi:hypothetical protein